MRLKTGIVALATLVAVAVAAFALERMRAKAARSYILRSATVANERPTESASVAMERRPSEESASDLLGNSASAAMNVLRFYYSQPSNEVFVAKMRHLYAASPDAATLSEFKAQAANASNTALRSRALNPHKMYVQAWDDETRRAYLANELMTIRAGGAENHLVLCRGFGLCPPWRRPEGNMFDNAGLYAPPERRDEVLEWFTRETLELASGSVRTFCRYFIGKDLLVWASLGVSGPVYSWNAVEFQDLVLRHSAGKRVLFVGQATESVKQAFANLERYYLPPLADGLARATMLYVHVPQTTTGFGEPPDASSIETTRRILDQIEGIEFDTALVACGGYAAPIINGLRKRHKGRKNLIYAASAIYWLFGIENRGNNLTAYAKEYPGRTRPDRGITAAEHYNATQMSKTGIDQGKYWSKL